MGVAGEGDSPSGRPASCPSSPFHLLLSNPHTAPSPPVVMPPLSCGDFCSRRDHVSRRPEPPDKARGRVAEASPFLRLPVRLPAKHVRRDDGRVLLGEARHASQAQVALSGGALLVAADSARLHVALLLLLRDVLSLAVSSTLEVFAFTAYAQPLQAAAAAVAALQSADGPRLLLPAATASLSSASPRLAFLWAPRAWLAAAAHALVTAVGEQQTLHASRLALSAAAPLGEPAAFGASPEAVAALARRIASGLALPELLGPLRSLRPLSAAAARTLRGACVARLRTAHWSGAPVDAPLLATFDASIAAIEAAAADEPPPPPPPDKPKAALPKAPLMSFGGGAEGASAPPAAPSAHASAAATAAAAAAAISASIAAKREELSGGADGGGEAEASGSSSSESDGSESEEDERRKRKRKKDKKEKRKKEKKERKEKRRKSEHD